MQATWQERRQARRRQRRASPLGWKKGRKLSQYPRLGRAWRLRRLEGPRAKARSHHGHRERRPRGPNGSGSRTGANRMQAERIVEYLQAQAGKDVVLRVAGQGYAIRGISAAGAAVIIAAGDVLTSGAAVAPQDALREAEQITPVAEVVPDAVLQEGEGGQPPPPE